MQIVEASYDSMWGTGISLHQRDCLDTNKKKSSGLLGKMLMQIRSHLQKIPRAMDTNADSLAASNEQV